jgi:hypothetical protein
LFALHDLTCERALEASHRLTRPEWVVLAGAGEAVPGLLEEAVRHYNDSAAKGVGGTSPDTLGLSWSLLVRKSKRAPTVLFETESVRGVDRRQVLPGTNV